MNRIFLYRLVCIAFFIVINIAKCTNYTLYGIKIVKKINGYAHSASAEGIGYKITRMHACVYVCLCVCVVRVIDALLHRSNIIFFITPVCVIRKSVT